MTAYDVGFALGSGGMEKKAMPALAWLAILGGLAATAPAAYGVKKWFLDPRKQALTQEQQRLSSLQTQLQRQRFYNIFGQNAGRLGSIWPRGMGYQQGMY